MVVGNKQTHKLALMSKLIVIMLQLLVVLSIILNEVSYEKWMLERA